MDTYLSEVLDTRDSKEPTEVSHFGRESNVSLSITEDDDRHPLLLSSSPSSFLLSRRIGTRKGAEK